ncbi:hypothetical protein Lal_00034222 [Lupinus albus]|nr:hypothetical protein Lal_00034222 [Lupinus albus]
MSITYSITFLYDHILTRRLFLPHLMETESDIDVASIVILGLLLFNPRHNLGLGVVFYIYLSLLYIYWQAKVAAKRSKHNNLVRFSQSKEKGLK